MKRENAKEDKLMSKFLFDRQRELPYKNMSKEQKASAVNQKKELIDQFKAKRKEKLSETSSSNRSKRKVAEEPTEKQDNKRLKRQLLAQKRELAAMTLRLKEQRTEIKRLRKLTLSDPEVYERINSERNKLRGNVASLTDTNKDLVFANSRLTNIIDNLRDEVAVLTDKNKNIQRQMFHTQVLQEEFVGKLVKKESELKQLKMQLIQASNRQVDLEKMKVKDEEIRRLVNKITNYKQQIAQQEKAYNRQIGKQFLPFGTIHEQIDQLGRNMNTANIRDYKNINFLVSRYNYFKGKVWYDNWESNFGVVENNDGVWQFTCKYGVTTQIDIQGFRLNDGDVYEAAIRQAPLLCTLLRPEITDKMVEISIEQKRIAYRKKMATKYPAKNLSQSQAEVIKIVKRKSVLIISAATGMNIKRQMEKYHINATGMDENNKSIPQIVQAALSNKYDYKYVLVSGISHSLYNSLLKNHADEQVVFLYDSNPQGIIDDIYEQEVSTRHSGIAKIAVFFSRMTKK